MKPIFIYTLILLFLFSCGKKEYEEQRQGLEQTADSLSKVLSARLALQQARLDSIREDSLARVAKAVEQSNNYDILISKCETAAKQFHAWTKYDMDNFDVNDDNFYGAEKVSDVYMRYQKYHEEILKVIDNFTPVQRRRVEKIEEIVSSTPIIYWD